MKYGEFRLLKLLRTRIIMSRIGKKPIKIPAEVQIRSRAGEIVVAGPKGELLVDIPDQIRVTIEDNRILVQRESDQKKVKALHGTIRQLLANAIVGVTEGWEKELEVVGTGYRVAKEGDKLILSLGFSHKVPFEPPSGIVLQVEGQNKIKVAGTDKALVGRTAATIRSIRPPDAYKGKGIRYLGEEIKLKPGKAAKGITGEVG